MCLGLQMFTEICSRTRSLLLGTIDLVSYFSDWKKYYCRFYFVLFFLPLFLRASLISSHIRSNSGSSSAANIAWAVSFKLHALCLITLSEKGEDSETYYKTCSSLICAYKVHAVSWVYLNSSTVALSCFTPVEKELWHETLTVAKQTIHPGLKFPKLFCSI